MATTWLCHAAFRFRFNAYQELYQLFKVVTLTLYSVIEPLCYGMREAMKMVVKVMLLLTLPLRPMTRTIRSKQADQVGKKHLIVPVQLRRIARGGVLDELGGKTKISQL